jgi:hypothetical protein
MKEEKIDTGNRLIAEFMGFSIKEFHGMLCLCGEDESPWDYDPIHFFAPHQSWSDLMPVVEKIESIRDEEYGWFRVDIASNSCSIQSEHLWRSVQGEDVEAYISDPNAILNTKIESTWYNVVEFIEWWNYYTDLKQKQ